MKQLRVGIIGIGNIGSAHLHWISGERIPGMELTAVCDIDEKKREYLKKTYSFCRVFEDYHSLLHSGLTDAVIIATPHYLHPVIAVEAFHAGQHVLTEKPAGVYTGAVRRMNEEAKKSGKQFGIMFNQRTNPLFVKAREIVQSGRLGALKRSVWIVTNWYRTQAYYDSGDWRATWSGEGGGILLNQAPHNLDLWQWILGMPKRIRAFCDTGKYHRIGVEDDVTIYAEYENGARGTFITTTGEAPGTNRLEISGDCGKLVLEDGKLRWWKLAVPEREFCFSAKEEFYQPEITYEEYEEEAPEGHPCILTNFADVILHGGELIAPGYEGLNELSISNAAYLSAWTDDWAELPVKEEKFEYYLKQRCKEESLQEKEKAKKAETLFTKTYSERWKVRW